jgi:bacterioferritin-associated ferredoxin
MELNREEWCRAQARSGNKGLQAIFQAGEVLRCPVTRTLSRGAVVTCGGPLERAPWWVKHAVVRVMTGLRELQGTKPERRTCGKCGKCVDVFLIPQEQELRATG